MTGKLDHLSRTRPLLSDWFQRLAVYCVAGVGYLFALFLLQRTPLSVLALTALYAAWLVLYHLGKQRRRSAWQFALCGFTCAALFLPLPSVNGYWLPILPTMTACLLVTLKPRARGIGLAAALWLCTSLALCLLTGLWDSGGQIILLISFCASCGCALTISDLAAAHRQLQAYSVQLEELAVVRERNRIARDIHDTLGHSLSLLSVQLEMALQLERRADPHLREELQGARQVVKDCLTDVRRSVEALRPEEVGVGSLQQQLRRLVAEFESTCRQTSITLDLEDAILPLHADLSQTLYRCAQEALTNIRKHADATKVLLRLSTSGAHEDQVELTVLDNGIARHEQHTTGFGLRGMRERVALLDGQLRAGPQAGHGWRVEVVLPLKGAV